MKLFEKTGKVDVKEYHFGNEVVRQEKIELALVPETVDYLLDEKNGGKTVEAIRQLIVNLYNCNTFEAPDLFTLLRNSDEEHGELVIDILEACLGKYGFSCFAMINDVAPEIIERFSVERIEEAA